MYTAYIDQSACACPGLSVPGRAACDKSVHGWARAAVLAARAACWSQCKSPKAYLAPKVDCVHASKKAAVDFLRQKSQRSDRDKVCAPPVPHAYSVIRHQRLRNNQRLSAQQAETCLHPARTCKRKLIRATRRRPTFSKSCSISFRELQAQVGQTFALVVSCWRSLAAMDEGLASDTCRHAMEDLCRTLNIDEQTCAKAWSSFVHVSERYPLNVSNFDKNIPVLALVASSFSLVLCV